MLDRTFYALVALSVGAFTASMVGTGVATKIHAIISAFTH